MRDSIIDRVALALYQDGIRVQAGEEGEGCFILGDYPAKSNPTFSFMLWAGKGAMGAFVNVLRDIPPEKHGEILREINRLNTGHQWVKFVLLEEQNSVQGTYDFPIDYKVGKALDYDYASHQIGRAVADLVEFLVIAADEAYPQLAEIAYS